MIRKFTFYIYVIKKTYIITGATGFLGQKLTRELVKEADNVILFTREKAGVSSTNRICSLFNFNIEEQKQVRVIDCDIENMSTARDSHDFKDVKNLKIDGIWHLAANLSFRSKDKQSVHNVNFIGTQHIVKLAIELNAPLFYVSTAYVHGQRVGLLKEGELIRSKFNNAYEESKFITEEYLKVEEKKNGIRYIIFRPAILIDVDDTLSSLNAPFGYYSILQLMHNSVLHLRNFTGNHKIIASILGLRIDARGIMHSHYIPFVVANTTLNLVPVDVAVTTMIQIVNRANFKCGTFHIVSPKALPMRKIAEITFEELKIKVRTVVLPRVAMLGIFRLIYFFSKLFPGLVNISKKLHQYGYYMTKTYHFDIIQTEKVRGAREYADLFSSTPEDLRNAARVFISKQELLVDKSI